MASSSSNARTSLGLLLLLLLLSLAQVARGARSLPAAAGSPSEDKREPTEAIDDGTVLIPGYGRVVIGEPVMDVPSIPDLDHSVPAAMSGKFIPGADDTFTPNPGFEVPNPLHP